RRGSVITDDAVELRKVARDHRQLECLEDRAGRLSLEQELEAAHHQPLHISARAPITPPLEICCRHCHRVLGGRVSDDNPDITRPVIVLRLRPHGDGWARYGPVACVSQRAVAAFEMAAMSAPRVLLAVL